MRDSRLPLSIVLLLVCSLSATAQNTPALDSLFKPKIWLRADIGLSANSWKDQSGNEMDATPSTEGKAPTSEASINYNPALIFNGTDDRLQVPFSLENLNDFTIMAVYDATDTAEMGVWGTENAIIRKILLTTKKVYGPEEVVDTYSNTDSLPVLNTIVQNWGETNDGPETGIFIIGHTGNGDEVKKFKGDIAEVIVFDQSLPYLERIKYQTYLAVKYGIGHKSNYVSSANTLLWDTEKNSTYSNRIIGLGRDDAFSLNQKQAKSAYDSTGFMQVSVGLKKNTNKENSSNIANGNFLIMGDNGLNLLDEDREGEDSLLYALNRKWLVKPTGLTVRNIKTNIGIDIKQLPDDSLGYYLLIDRSGQGNFKIDNLEYIEADSITSDSIAWYSNVQWDIDGSGEDAFSFGRIRYMLAFITGLENPDCHVKTNGKVGIKVLGGRPHYKFVLTNSGSDLSRSWSARDSTFQKDLPVGSYELKVLDADKFIVNRSFALQIPGGLKVDLGEDRKLEDDQELFLDASAFIPDSINVSYSWENNFGFSSEEKKIKVEESGIYTATVINEGDGCEFQDKIVISGAEVKRFTVVPNVTSAGKVRVNVSLDEPAPVTIQILDAGGAVIYEQKTTSGSEFQFTPEVKNPGIFLVVLQTPKGIDSRKLIIY